MMTFINEIDYKKKHIVQYHRYKRYKYLSYQKKNINVQSNIKTVESM